MLYEFLDQYRDAIIAKTRDRIGRRPWPAATSDELEHGVPLFLSQLSDTLRLEHSGTPFSGIVMAASATRHGEALLAGGFTVSQVVHDYGDICQAITELAAEVQAPITIDEFHILNRCLDTAIAEAVTEHARLTGLARSAEEVERFGFVAHELRDLLNTAVLSFHALKSGTVAINGSTADVHGRSLLGLRDLIDRSLVDVRLRAGQERRERVYLAVLIDDIAVSALLQAEYRKIALTIRPVDRTIVIDADSQLIQSAITNLLNNALKFTAIGGCVSLRTSVANNRLLIEIEDQCGGIAEGSHLFESFGERRAADRTGLGLGLALARKAVRAHSGDITVRNVAGTGCVFVIDLPIATPNIVHAPTLA
jgi:signal transduction histidine kinase